MSLTGRRSGSELLLACSVPPTPCSACSCRCSVRDLRGAAEGAGVACGVFPHLLLAVHPVGPARGPVLPDVPQARDDAGHPSEQGGAGGGGGGGGGTSWGYIHDLLVLKLR